MIVTREVSRERLLAIATHLEKPQENLHCNTFDFKIVHEVNGCGTNGCAMGEAPVIFPEKYAYPQEPDSDGDLIPYDIETGSYVSSTIGDFLGIPWDHVEFLFYPSGMFCRLHETEVVKLRGNATKEEVAANIRRYVAVFLPDPVERKRYRDRLLGFADHLDTLPGDMLVDQMDYFNNPKQYPSDIRYICSILGTETYGVADYFGQTVNAFNLHWLSIPNLTEDFTPDQDGFILLRLLHPQLCKHIDSIYRSTNKKDLATHLRNYVSAFLPDC